MIINTNDTLFRIHKALNLSIKQMIEAYTLEEYKIEGSHIESLMARKRDKNFILCSYEELGIFLDGLVTLKRGVSPKKAPIQESVELTNNLVLKKLRIALELKESDVEIIFGLADISLSKQQLASLFRKETHKNFRACSDSLLVSFLEGLDEFYYSGEEI